MAPSVIFCNSQLSTVLLKEEDKINRVDDLLHTFLCKKSCDKLSLSAVSLFKSSVYVLCNGRKVTFESPVEDDNVYHIIPRVLGGKGGFGSMLRAIGAQIEKTTSREACRDLSGRRMRDINNEKKLKEWLAKEAEREQEKEARSQERLAKRLAPHRHKFDDKEYLEQKIKVQEDLQEALSTGLKRKQNKSEDKTGCSKKLKEASCSSSKAEWLGVDIDSDDMDSSSDANPGCQEEPLKAEEISASEDSVSSLPHLQETGETTSEATNPTSSESNSYDHVARLDNASSTIENEQTTVSSNQVHNGSQQVLPVSDSEPVDLESFHSAEKLSTLGLERLKNALIARGLKCGGTLQERAQRLFSVKGLAPDEIDPSLLASSKGKGKGKKSK